MPTWAIVLIWVVVAAVVLGAVVERRRGIKGGHRPDEVYDGKRDDFESRARMRGHSQP